MFAYLFIYLFVCLCIDDYGFVYVCARNCVWALGKSVFGIRCFGVHRCGSVSSGAATVIVAAYTTISIILERSNVAACYIALCSAAIILRFVECLPIITRISCVRLLVSSQSFSECGRDQS